MSGSAASLRIILRNAVVLALAFIAIAFSVSDIVVPWHPYGVLGAGFAPDGTVLYVIPKTWAAEAGIQPGDRVNFGALPPAQ